MIIVFTTHNSFNCQGFGTDLRLFLSQPKEYFTVFLWSKNDSNVMDCKRNYFEEFTFL